MRTLGEWRHLCVDMQRMFLEDTPWYLPWMPRVAEVAGRHTERTVFTRFMPPQTASQGRGTWKDYYLKWGMMTGEHIAPELLDLVPPAGFTPPGRVFDKTTYSTWIDGRLHRVFETEHVSTLVITGGETDVCVLSAILGAIDLGHRVILVADAICSGADETHDASLRLLGDRFSVQLQITTSEDFLSRA